MQNLAYNMRRFVVLERSAEAAGYPGQQTETERRLGLSRRRSRRDPACRRLLALTGLYAWRRKALSSGMVAPLTEGANKPVKFTRFEAMASATVEIAMRAGGDVDPDYLAKILRAARKA